MPIKSCIWDLKKKGQFFMIHELNSVEKQNLEKKIAK